MVMISKDLQLSLIKHGNYLCNLNDYIIRQMMNYDLVYVICCYCSF